MKDQAIHIPFKNAHHPDSKFDLIRIEELLNRKAIWHDIYDFHLVEFYNIFFVEEGSGQHTIDFTDYDCKPGTVLTIRKDQLQKFLRSDMKGSMLLFTDEFVENYLEKQETLKTLQLFNELLGHPIIQLEGEELEEITDIIKRIRKEYMSMDQQYSSSIIRSELHILITKLYRLKSSRKNIIFDKQYLNEFITFQNLLEQKVTHTNRVQDYAQMMGVSTKTLTKISKSIINKTAKEFIDEIYIKQIKRLLLNTSHSIKEIAYMTGFEEPSNFYKYFKRHTATTPEQFRT